MGITLGSAGFYGSVNVNYFIEPQLNLELGAGLGYYGGARYHFLKKSYSFSEERLQPYVGVLYSLIPYKSFLAAEWNGFFFPLGVQYTLPKGIALSAEIGYKTGYEGATAMTARAGFWPGFKVGYYFKSR